MCHLYDDFYILKIFTQRLSNFRPKEILNNSKIEFRYNKRSGGGVSYFLCGIVHVSIIVLLFIEHTIRFVCLI